jgi:hypothetical protein
MYRHFTIEVMEAISIPVEEEEKEKPPSMYTKMVRNKSLPIIVEEDEDTLLQSTYSIRRCRTSIDNED